MMEEKLVRALCELFGCSADMIADRGPGRVVIGGKPFFIVGPGSPAGLPAAAEISLVGSRDGYSVYGFSH